MTDQRISLQELEAKFRDPDFPEEKLRAYFTADPQASRPFNPSFRPDPGLVEVPRGAWLMNWFNVLARDRRHNRFERRIDKGEQLPVLVSEGDSWFQFPLLLKDVIDQLDHRYLIWSVDAAGDTLQNMVFESPEYMTALRSNRHRVRAFLFSGAGNDMVGEDADGVAVIEKVVKPYKPGESAAWHIDTPEFAAKLAFVEEAYRKVLATVASELPALPVICHGYDYALPGGGPDEWRHPIYAAKDGWLGRPLREKGVRDPALQREIVREMIDALNGVLKRLCGRTYAEGEFPNAAHVDVRGLLNPSEWADELHPTDDGFARVAEKFVQVVTNALPVV